MTMLTGAVQRCGDVHKLPGNDLQKFKLCWPENIRLTAISSGLYDDCPGPASLANAHANFTDWWYRIDEQTGV